MLAVPILLFFGKYVYLTIQNMQENKILKDSTRLLFRKALKSSRALEYLPKSLLQAYLPTFH